MFSNSHNICRITTIPTISFWWKSITSNFIIYLWFLIVFCKLKEAAWSLKTWIQILFIENKNIQIQYNDNFRKVYNTVYFLKKYISITIIFYVSMNVLKWDQFTEQFLNCSNNSNYLLGYNWNFIFSGLNGTWLMQHAWKVLPSQ